VDSSGNLYIADESNLRVRKVSNGVITTVAGGGAPGPPVNNGSAADAQFLVPISVAVDSAGNLYIGDGNHLVRKVSNGVITTVAGNGTFGSSGDNGPATSAQILPNGLAVDSSGNLYIADRFNSRIRKVSNGVITTVAGNGTSGFSGDNGPATSAQVNPESVAVDSAGNLFIAEGIIGQRIRKVSNGVITTVAGNGTAGFSGDNGPATSAGLSGPTGVTVDSAGNFYIADGFRIREISNGVITTVAGGGSSIGDNGPATSAQLNNLSGYSTGVAVDSAGNLYIPDYGRIRKVSKSVITTVAGTGTIGFSGDNGPATSAELVALAGLAVDSSGDIYIADNNRIRKISNGVITTVAGGGSSIGDNGPAMSAALNPAGVAVDSSGNLYIPEVGRIRKVSNGAITTVAGGGFSIGDNGPATSAQLGSALSVAVDSLGNLYIGDQFNYRIRKVSKGVITTVAGNGTSGFSGDNGPATSAQVNPASVAVDAAGNLYIPDLFTNPRSGLESRIRKISNGVITTVAGNGTSGFSGDNGLATSAALNSPAGVAVDSLGRVYFADTGNSRIRVLTPVFTNKNSASYAAGALAADMIAFGEAPGVVPQLVVASTNPWPTELDGVHVAITDSQGQLRQAPIYFAAPNSVGYLVSAGTALGPASVTLTTPSGSFSGAADIGTISPGLYSANATGSGAAAGFWISVDANGARIQDYLFDLATRNPTPIDLGPPTNQIYLSLYGTGFRGSTGQITATVGGVGVPVLGAVLVAAYQGEDVVNIGPLPRSLAGRGEISIVMTFDGKSANTVTVAIR
jgi:uncharacterized protein (TIGR03437 family)